MLPGVISMLIFIRSPRSRAIFCAAPYALYSEVVYLYVFMPVLFEIIGSIDPNNITGTRARRYVSLTYLNQY